MTITKSSISIWSFVGCNFVECKPRCNQKRYKTIYLVFLSLSLSLNLRFTSFSNLTPLLILLLLRFEFKSSEQIGVLALLNCNLPFIIRILFFLSMFFASCYGTWLKYCVHPLSFYLHFCFIFFFFVNLIFLLNSSFVCCNDCYNMLVSFCIGESHQIVWKWS